MSRLQYKSKMTSNRWKFVHGRSRKNKEVAFLLLGMLDSQLRVPYVCMYIFFISLCNTVLSWGPLNHMDVCVFKPAVLYVPYTYSTVYTSMHTTQYFRYRVPYGSYSNGGLLIHVHMKEYICTVYSAVQR